MGISYILYANFALGVEIGRHIYFVIPETSKHCLPNCLI